MMKSFNYNSQLPYPVYHLPDEIRDFVYCVRDATQAKEALIGPIVLATMAAAVQGVVEISTPFHTVMPTSLFVCATAVSGDRKSTVVKQACYGFEDFERRVQGRSMKGSNYTELGAHPFILEDATESGIVDLYANGAQSLYHVMDEGAILMKHLDIPTLCKQFDGAPLRVMRKHCATLVHDTRTSLCMTIQDRIFDQMMSGKKGPVMVESGLMPRMLMSFTSNMPNGFVKAHNVRNPREHSFHQRTKGLMHDYSEKLQSSSPKDKISLSPEAEQIWRNSLDSWNSRLETDEKWKSIQPFVKRAGEHALRVAAVLQWFTAPQAFIGCSLMQAAVNLVDWHLGQAEIGFSAPSQEDVQVQLGEELYAYLLRKAKVGQTCIARNTLIRCAPANLRKADKLDLAIDQLYLEDKIGFMPAGSRKYVVMNMTTNPYVQNNTVFIGPGNY